MAGAFSTLSGKLWFGTGVESKEKIAEVKAFVGRTSTYDGVTDSTRESTREYFGDIRKNEKDGAVSEPIQLTAGHSYYIQALEVNRQGRATR